MSRPTTTPSAFPRRLREDFGLAALRDRRPVRRLGGDWFASILVLALVVAVLSTAVSADLFMFRYGLPKPFGFLLAAAQSAALVLVLFRPVPAWWLATLSTLATVPFIRAVGPGAPEVPWNLIELPLLTLLFFFFAQLVPVRTAVVGLLIHLLPTLVFVIRFQSQSNSLLALTVATALGAALRGRHLARRDLVAQEELTVQEKARRTLLEERTRIARELHDVVAHHMSVISVQAQVAVHLAENPSEELKENLAGIRANAVDALIELRRVLGVLRSEESALDANRHAPQPTLDRLDDLLGTVRSTGLTVTTATTGEPRLLPPGVDLSAYRIVQEALSNAMRHAPGAEVRVELAYRTTELTLTVTNSRPHRPTPPGNGTGHGLLGMRERVAMLGGRIATGPTPEGGYAVTALLPTAAKTSKDTP
ncbi:histidine kinase [Kitasatospora sp. MMS16-BH015]|uniref:sensor histidine kinase n=1 Tax=Kitasatospora sp. MMS16-BH015 TaxID=2018025 RepID=UPI000CA0C619|nr:sensor histidine kinase [Kitasatospora sp. MMS16-BH015]AUG78672.1 histidine kinase [Kitasatospora sp. MMS16-BH015]